VIPTAKESAVEPLRSPTKSAVLLALKLAVSVGLIMLILSKIDLGELKSRLLSPDTTALAVAILLAGVQVVVVAWRFGRVLAALGRTIGLTEAVTINMIGLFFNQSLPSTIGGDAMRIWRLIRSSAPLGVSVRGVLLDRITALIGIVILIALTLPLLFRIVDDRKPVMAFTVIVAIAIFGIVVAVAIPRVPAALARWRMARGIGALLGDLRRIVLQPRQSVPVLGVAVIGHLMTTVIVYSLARAYGVGVGYLECLVLVSPVTLISVVPISIAGWGVREGAMVAAFALVGIAAADALAISVAFGLLNILIGLPGGLVFLATNGTSKSN
jgi:glycosyltransferase 2 family protein